MSDSYRDLINEIAIAKGLPVGSPARDVISKKSRLQGSIDCKRYHEEFEELLKLNRNEKLLMSFCTALQVLRWTIVGMLKPKMGTPKTSEETNALNRRNEDTKTKLKKEKEQEATKYANKRESSKYRSAHELIMDGVPYDVTGLGGKFHRQNTLGHDPVLGWIFGTANIITDTVTNKYFTTYKAFKKGDSCQFELGNPPIPVSIFSMFNGVRESLMEDKFRLPAALYAQSVHLRSDIETSQGLPFPILGTILNKCSFIKTKDGWKNFNELYKKGYEYLKAQQELQIDFKSQAISGAVSVLINLTICFLHWLLYDNKEDKEYYFAKTLKIIYYSNIIATSSNLATTVFAPQMFDFAGAINTAMVYVGTQLKVSNLEGKYFGRRLLEDFRQTL